MHKVQVMRTEVEDNREGNAAAPVATILAKFAQGKRHSCERDFGESRRTRNEGGRPCAHLADRTKKPSSRAWLARTYPKPLDLELLLPSSRVLRTPARRAGRRRSARYGRQSTEGR